MILWAVWLIIVCGELLPNISDLSYFLAKVCGGDLPYVSPESLEEKHHFHFREALHAFSSTKKMGGQEFCDRYQAQLEKELEEMWQSYIKHNEVRSCSLWIIHKLFPSKITGCTTFKELHQLKCFPSRLRTHLNYFWPLNAILICSITIHWIPAVSFSLKSKNLFSAFRTPAVLFVLVCLLYVLSGVLLFIGLSTFALICDCTLGVVMMSMLTWAFIRYSGRYQSVGGAIDQAAGVVLEQVRKFTRQCCSLVSVLFVAVVFVIVAF